MFVNLTRLPLLSMFTMIICRINTVSGHHFWDRSLNHLNFCSARKRSQMHYYQSPASTLPGYTAKANLTTLRYNKSTRFLINKMSIPTFNLGSDNRWSERWTKPKRDRKAVGIKVVLLQPQRRLHHWACPVLILACGLAKKSSLPGHQMKPQPMRGGNKRN